MFVGLLCQARRQNPHLTPIVAATRPNAGALVRQQGAERQSLAPAWQRHPAQDAGRFALP
eukprot:1443061-Alexandrium_andersonii.AAC.1